MDTIKIPACVTEDEKSQLLADGFIRLNDVIPHEELEWYRSIYDDCFSDDSKIKQLGGRMSKAGRRFRRF
ncbi:MAG: hypothetical protein MK080_06080 [Opitutales bacterium]|nr:hypothetical protein [Opitutales bacterium]NRA27066.1 hypothetical protein [Opitutales bacterium]